MMAFLNFVLAAIVIGVPAYTIGVTVYSYYQATGTTWERLVAAFKGSASILWARLNTLSVFAVGSIGEIGTMLGAPGVKDSIQPYLAPEYMIAYMAVVLVGAEIARRRTLA